MKKIKVISQVCKQNAMGFTLIEVLVVVLIIGILAAVALPQYQKAVWKSRMAQVFTFGASAQQALDLYVLEHGTLGGDEYNALTGTLANNPTGINLLENLTCSETTCQDDYFQYDAAIDSVAWWRVAPLEDTVDTQAQCYNNYDGTGWHCSCNFGVDNGQIMCQLFQQTFGGTIQDQRW